MGKQISVIIIGGLGLVGKELTKELVKISLKLTT